MRNYEQAEEPEEPEPLIIEIPETETEGSVTVFTSDGAVYGFYGDIKIINDGTDGNQITIELYGWLVGEYQHGEPEYKEEQAL